MNQRHQQYPKGKSEHPFVVSNYFADYIFAIYTSLGWISCSHGTTLGLMGVSLSRKIIISCAFGICQNYDQGCGADVTRSGSNYKISLGWVYGPQYHVILARFFLFFFVFAFLKNKATEHKSSIISLAQCMHKATETFAKHYRCEN